MHRVKRPSSKAEPFGLSQVQYRTNHDNYGDEPKTRVRRRKTADFQLNAAGGPLGEEFQEKD